MPNDFAGDSRRTRLAVPLLLAVATVALALRALSVAEPLGIDQSLWASAARGMARGQLLYRDVWEQRPPGIYFTYLAGFSLFGWREATVAWLDLIAAAFTTILLFDIGRLLAGRLSGAIAAACYAVLTMPAWLYAYGGFLERSVCETFTTPCAALAASAAARLYRGSARPLVLASVIGLSMGIAVIYKPNAGLYLPAIVLWLIWYWRFDWPVLATIAATAAVPIIATVAWLAALGLVEDARVAVVEFNRFYVAAGVTFDALGLAFAKAVWLRMKTDPLWAAGGIGALVATVSLIRDRRLSPLAGLAVLWGGAAALVIFVNGIRLFNSYFINALAPLAVMAAWVLADAARRSFSGRLIGAATLVVMAALLITRGYVPRVQAAALADYEVLTGRVPEAAYLERFGGYGNNRGYSARANRELAAYIATHSDPDDRVFLFGINGAGIYFLADRLTAHRFLRVNFFVPEGFPHPAFTRGAVIADLERSRPRFVVFERLHTQTEAGRAIDALRDDPIVVKWLDQYERSAEIEDFSVYRRK